MMEQAHLFGPRASTATYRRKSKLSDLWPAYCSLWYWLPSRRSFWLRTEALFVGDPDTELLKSDLQNTMATAALLGGFATGMTLSVSTSDIREYSEFIKDEFFGKDSHLCTFIVPHKVSTFSTLWASLHLVGSQGSVHELPNSIGVANGSTCDPVSQCWLGHWATNQATLDLGFDKCSLTAADFKVAYPAYYQETVQAKVLSVQAELGFNTMAIVMTSVFVTFLAVLLLFSLSKRPQRAQKWLEKFWWAVLLVEGLPLLNFFNFLELANRVIRVKLPFCDEFISYDCMVSNTPYFENLLTFLPVMVLVVYVVHMTLPAPVEMEELEQAARVDEEADEQVEETVDESPPSPPESRESSPGGANVAKSVLDQLESLDKLKGLLTEAEVARLKELIFRSAALEAPGPASAPVVGVQNVESKMEA